MAIRKKAHAGREGPGTVPTATGGIARLAYEQARKAKLNVPALLKDAKLTERQIADDRVRVPVKSQIRFLNIAADALQNDFLGLQLGQKVDLREVGLLYYVLVSSRNLDDALRRVARYSGINNEGIRLVYHRQASTAAITFQQVGVSRASDRHQIEFFVMVLFRICRQISGRRLTPQTIRFVHGRSSLPAGLRAFFGCPVRFGSNADEVIYAKSALAMPVVGADPFLNAVLERYCEEATTARRHPSSDWRTKVENAIVHLLPHGEARAPKVCRELGVSLRTLSRRLESEGLTFAKVLDDLRRELAERHLREADLPISEIAWLLGYRRSSSFNHAFKRWTGKAPGWLRANVKARA